MSANNKVIDEHLDDDAWESGELGTDPAHAQRVSSERRRQLHEGIDRATGMKSITIRLPAELIAAVKEIAEEGILYQPLIRHVLTRYVRDYTASRNADA